MLTQYTLWLTPHSISPNPFVWAVGWQPGVGKTIQTCFMIITQAISQKLLPSSFDFLRKPPAKQYQKIHEPTIQYNFFSFIKYSLVFL